MFSPLSFVECHRCSAQGFELPAFDSTLVRSVRLGHSPGSVGGGERKNDGLSFCEESGVYMASENGTGFDIHDGTYELSTSREMNVDT